MNSIKLVLDVNEREVEKAMAKEVAKQLNRILASMSADINIAFQIGQLLETQIKNTPEYDALVAGDLAAIFGLTDTLRILSKIIEAVKNSIIIEVEPVVITAAGLKGGIKVSALKDDFSEVLSLPQSSYKSDGGQVDWLEWLLTAGDSVVIADFDVSFGRSFVGSRTDLAIMSKSAVGFRVPPEYSGTLTNNWLTRALEGADELVGNILFVELNRRL